MTRLWHRQERLGAASWVSVAICGGGSRRRDRDRGKPVASLLLYVFIFLQPFTKVKTTLGPQATWKQAVVCRPLTQHAVVCLLLPWQPATGDCWGVRWHPRPPATRVVLCSQCWARALLPRPLRGTRPSPRFWARSLPQAAGSLHPPLAAGPQEDLVLALPPGFSCGGSRVLEHQNRVHPQ